MSIPPLVSVRALAYNHEPYIAQCLEGILMQRTLFPFEVVVGEDCSTDRTRDIVVAYARDFPDKIQVITSDVNVGAEQNMMRVLGACRGKYHAFCEGDDYWIDPLKLQKQVDFMEAHPDVTLSLHNSFHIKESDLSVRLHFSSPMNEILTFQEACQLELRLASVMVRADAIARLPEWRSSVFCSDVVMRLWCAHLGNIGYLPDVMAVYRKHPGGISRWGHQRQQRRSDELRVLSEFDRETCPQHTESVRALVHRVERRYQHERLGWAFFLLYPGEVIPKIKTAFRVLIKYYQVYH